MPLTFSCLKPTANSQSRSKRYGQGQAATLKELASPLCLLQITVERPNYQNWPSSCDFESLTNCHGCLRDCKPGGKLRQLREPQVPAPHQWQSRSYCFWDQIPPCVAIFEKIIKGELSFFNSLIMVTMSYEVSQERRILSPLKNEV